MVRIPKMPYSQIFEPPRILGRVLADDDFEILMEPAKGFKPGGILLHVSCQTMTVSHIPFLAQTIMQRLGLDFSTVGGPENCCGSYHWHMGDEEYERQVATMSLAGFRKSRPTRVVSTCPDCDASFDRHMARQHSYVRSNIAELFGEHVDKLKEFMTIPVNKKIAIHWHDDVPQRARDAANIRLLMEAVPGLEIVDTPKARGLTGHCVKMFGSVQQDVTEAMFTEAKSLGADYLVVPYQGCYRQHCKQQLVYGVEVSHYLSIIAQAIGIPFKEPFKSLRMLDDVDRAMDQLRPKIKRLGFSEPDVRNYLETAVYV
jgi:Fe-S oxidoreductase